MSPQLLLRAKTQISRHCPFGGFLMEEVMIVVRCESCDKYYSDDDLRYIQPDVGAFCPECDSDELYFLDDKEVIEALNESR